MLIYISLIWIGEKYPVVRFWWCLEEDTTERSTGYPREVRTLERGIRGYYHMILSHDNDNLEPSHWLILYVQWPMNAVYSRVEISGIRVFHDSERERRCLNPNKSSSEWYFKCISLQQSDYCTNHSFVVKTITIYQLWCYANLVSEEQRQAQIQYICAI